VKDWVTSSNIFGVHGAIANGNTFLVDCELNQGGYFVEDFVSVLETDEHAIRSGGLRENCDEVDGILLGQLEAPTAVVV
jgi:hypothetical protein